MILWGAVLLLSPLVLAVPIEHDESVSDDLVISLPALLSQSADPTVVIASLCTACCISAVQGWRVYVESTGCRGIGEWRRQVGLCAGQAAKFK